MSLSNNSNERVYHWDMTFPYLHHCRCDLHIYAQMPECNRVQTRGHDSDIPIHWPHEHIHRDGCNLQDNLL